jgi:hypothetical protein
MLVYFLTRKNDVQGGRMVLAKVGWFAFQETIKYRRSESGFSTNSSVMRVYQCGEGACVGNNTCNGNRTGLLCGYCAPGYALELQVCTKCSSGDNVLKTLTTFLIALGVLLVLLILFLTGWREVAVGNYVHRGYDKLIAALSAGIRKMVLLISMKDKAETEYGEIEKFLNDPIVHKLLAQGAKIAIGVYMSCSVQLSFS